MAEVRLQKILADAGVASRRAAEALIRAGRVTVDGRAARLGDRADPERQVVALDGRPLEREPGSYWLLYKPRGVLTTTRDPERRRTVLDLLPPGLPRLFPVGRLDRDSEGLLLLTNDGAVAQALLHPSLGSEREYEVRVRGCPSQATLARLARGVRLEDGTTAPARVGPLRSDARRARSAFRLTLREGRKRQIRRSLEALGHPVDRLVRVRMGPLVLGRLRPGEARPLAEREIARLRRHAAACLAARPERQRGGTGAAQAPDAPPESGRRPRNDSRKMRPNR